jgi:hypothetical protein
MSIVKIGNSEVEFEKAANRMDDDIREQLHADVTLSGPRSEQAFMDAYVMAHKAKFGEDFEAD